MRALKKKETKDNQNSMNLIRDAHESV